jgi:hypothetical protein
VTSSVSGLLSNQAHVRQARSWCLCCCPGVTVITLSRPPHRARSGHAHGSGVWLSDLANLRTLPAWTRSHISRAARFIPRIFRIMDTSAVTARTVQGMARVRSGQAPAWPLVSDRSVRSGSRVKGDFACTLTGAFPPVLVILRAQSRLELEGRTRMLSGPSPDLTSSVSECRHPGSSSGLIAVTWAYAHSRSSGYLAVSCVDPRRPRRSRAVVGPSLGIVNHQLRRHGQVAQDRLSPVMCWTMFHVCPRLTTRVVQQQYRGSISAAATGRVAPP